MALEFDKNDVSVGVFVVVVVAVFIAAAFSINHARMASKRYLLRIELTEVAGIDKGALVQYRGYQAGQVERVSVTYEPQFRFIVEFAVKNEIQLPSGSKVIVRGKGFSGGRFLDLIAADGARGAMLRDGALLPSELEPDLMAKANDVLGEARNVVRRLTERGSADELAGLIHDARLVTADLRTMMANVNAVLAENRTALKETLGAAHDLSKSRGPAVDRSLKNLDEAMTHLPVIMKTLEDLVADLKKHPWRLVRKGEP